MFYRCFRVPFFGDLVLESTGTPNFLDRGTGPRRGEVEGALWGVRFIWSPDRVQRRLDRLARERAAFHNLEWERRETEMARPAEAVL